MSRNIPEPHEAIRPSWQESKRATNSLNAIVARHATSVVGKVFLYLALLPFFMVWAFAKALVNIFILRR